MSEEDVLFVVSAVSLRRQQHLTRFPRVGEVEKLPFVLLALIGLQIFLLAIQGAAGHRFLKHMENIECSFPSYFRLFYT